MVLLSKRYFDQFIVETQYFASLLFIYKTCFITCFCFVSVFVTFSIKGFDLQREEVFCVAEC